MDKILRNSLIGGIALISVSISYYYVIFLPNNEAISSQQELDTKPLANIENLSAEDQKILCDYVGLKTGKECINFWKK